MEKYRVAMLLEVEAADQPEAEQIAEQARRGGQRAARMIGSGKVSLTCKSVAVVTKPVAKPREEFDSAASAC